MTRDELIAAFNSMPEQDRARFRDEVSRRRLARDKRRAAGRATVAEWRAKVEREKALIEALMRDASPDEIEAFRNLFAPWHGTTQGYRYRRCRCIRCRKAWATYNRERRRDPVVREKHRRTAREWYRKNRAVA
jgi:hypothetical protein